MNHFQNILVFSVTIVSINCLSIGISSENVTDRGLGDFYPDWVPFKNKKGAELGEFVQVTKKPKKRLAPPMNFIIRAVAEPQDDYFEKGQGESDGEEYYERKEWSDVNRPAQAVDKASLNHTAISDIEGIVETIQKPNPIAEALKIQSGEASKEVKESQEIKKQIFDDEEDMPKPKVQESKEKKSEEEADYEENSSVEAKPKPATLTPEEEKAKKESEARKAQILSEVDDLKERHAQEQRLLAEKVKEDEMYREQIERDRIHSGKSQNKYGHIEPHADYDERHEIHQTSGEDKYRIRPLRRRTTISTTTRAAPRKNIRRNKQKQKKQKKVESGKLSVFKNPRAYMVYDDSEDEGEKTPTTTTKVIVTPTRYSSRYTTAKAPIKENRVRILLVPEETDSKDGEPTLFFPKKKSKKRRKNKNSTVGPDVSDDSVSKSEKDLYNSENTSLTAIDATASGSTPSASEKGPGTSEFTTEEDSSPSAASAPSAVASDAVPASTDHKASPKKPENYHLERGGEKEHHSEHEESHEEHGKKAYENRKAHDKDENLNFRKFAKPKTWYKSHGLHKDTKTKKGHHDKENHSGQYDDHGGHDKHHHDETGHYGSHHHEEQGKKQAKYEESGKHSKGHSTKGSHDIHKKEEYEKKVEFFEEDGDSAEEEKHGGHTHEQSHKSGGGFKKGGHKAGYHGHDKGDKGHYVKGGHIHSDQGHKKAAGHDSHGKHAESHKHGEGKVSGKKWIYHHGHPAKTANLVVIDRRLDQYQHGPRYFG